MKAFRSLLTAHATPQHAHKTDAHGMLKVVLGVVSRIQKQLIDYHAHIDSGEIEDDVYTAKAEHLRQTLGAIEREVGALLMAARNLIKAFAQLDANMRELESHVVKHESEGNGAHAG